jgi:hypothetical protein
MQILTQLPAALRAEVYSNLCGQSSAAEGVAAAASLPPALLCAWLEVHAPDLDLAGAELTAAGWGKLLACVGPLGASVTALRLGLPHGVATGDEHARRGAPAILAALDAACMHLPRLRALSFGGLLVRSEQLPALCGAIAAARGVEELGIWDDAWWDASLAADVFATYDAAAKRCLFRALAALPQLCALRVPAWKAFVGSDGDAAAPLLRHPSLQAVWVRVRHPADVSNSEAFTRGLNFQAINRCAAALAHTPPHISLALALHACTARRCMHVLQVFLAPTWPRGHAWRAARGRGGERRVMMMRAAHASGAVPGRGCGCGTRAHAAAKACARNAAVAAARIS